MLGEEFSFNGRHCSEFGLHYIPTSKSRWPSSADWKSLEEDVTGRPGGYWYGTKVSIREFSLPCYFEDLTDENLEAALRWLDRRSEGWLVFDDRPEVRYRVRPSDSVEGELWRAGTMCAYGRERASGKVTLEFKAYEPFGQLTMKAYDYDADIVGVTQRCGMVHEDMMPAAFGKTAGTYLVYNPGTEDAYPVFKFSGQAPNGLTLTNHTTGEVCSLAAFNETGSWDESAYLLVDSKRGYVGIEPTGETAFEYHLDGFIHLAPCTPYERKIVFATEPNSNEADVYNAVLDESWVGAYAWIEDQWIRISYVRSGGKKVVLSQNATQRAANETILTHMNEIELSGDGLQLSGVELDYVPLVR